MIEYHEVDHACPKCGSRILADNVMGLRVKCSNETCDWKGDVFLLEFFARLKILKGLLLDEEYRQRLDLAKTWPEIDHVLMEFEEVCGEKTR